MNSFETFESLENYLKGHTDLGMTLRYLREHVNEEISFLVKDYNKKHPTIAWAKSSKKAEALSTINQAAREDYLEDINYYLQNDESLNHMSIMGYRRKPHAWAIADSIKQYERGKP